MKRRLAVVAGVALFSLATAGDVAAYPGGVLHAHTATAASHKFTIGDSTDRLQTVIRCSTTSGGLYDVWGPKVGVGVWSQAYCPRGSYRTGSEAVLLWG